jgi:aspartyl-tRNA(Asn)/glutamyl-tRNA(Gln) amidotransferase subunit A
MSDAPWAADACALIDAYRSGERSPKEELEATLDAIAASELNAFSHLDAGAARERAAVVDVAAPLGGLVCGRAVRCLSARRRPASSVGST